MDSCCAPDLSASVSEAYRRVLWIALGVNASMFLVEVVAGVAAGSVALQADALDRWGENPTRMRNHIMNQSWGNDGHIIGLKVGLNEGPALAVVNDERLDYFGQSVNIAARVQGLASSGEIWVSESIWNAPGTQDQIQKSGFVSEKLSATLKGVGTPATVFKLSSPT